MAPKKKSDGSHFSQVCVSMPTKLLERIDALTEKAAKAPDDLEGMDLKKPSRSGWITTACREKLAREGEQK